MVVPVNEQETTISYSRDSKEVDIWTCDTTVMNKLDKLCDESDYYKCISVGKSKIGGDILSKRYKLSDKKMLSFRSKKTTRKMTEEQREMAAERLRIAREQRQGAED